MKAPSENQRLLYPRTIQRSRDCPLHGPSLDEPETVEDREVVGERRPVHAVLDLQTTPRASRNAVIYARPSLQDHDATTTTLAAECAHCGGSWIGASAVLDLPLLGTEAADEEQYDADGQVGEDDAEPDVRVERVHEREDARLLLLRLLDHDADAEVHERLAEVDDSLAHRSDRHRSDRNVRRLRATNARATTTAADTTRLTEITDCLICH